jgi:epoxyqueuosine reductase
MNPSPSTLSQRLKARARALGFHAVGIASARPIDSARGALEERLRLGYLNGYGFSPGCEQEFTSPGLALPGARSVVAVALSYYYRPTCVDCDDFAPGAAGPRGRVSRFAWGEDYHKALASRLASLAEWLKGQMDCGTRICADTGPILDRAAAQQSGIGWYGKNCALIVPDYGSWVVLGELITTAELAPDPPCEIDGCGSCELCMKACPTGAIIEPGVIDANRCVSHLTQAKGYAPRELRGLIGDSVYGCDVCQSVCPQNRNAVPTNTPELMRATPPGRRPSLLSLLAMTREEFSATVASSTMGWIKLPRLRRNAIVALGNSGDPSVIPNLIEALSDQNTVVRGHAAWALGALGAGRAAVEAIKVALESESEAEAREEMEAALNAGA